jgi:hypothetical protein
VKKLGHWILRTLCRNDRAKGHGSSKSNDSTPGNRKRDISKNRIVFDTFLDATSSRSFILFGIRGDSEPYLPGCFDPFLEVAVARDNRLVFSLYKKSWPVSLTVEQWDAIARHAKTYHEKILTVDVGR